MKAESLGVLLTIGAYEGFKMRQINIFSVYLCFKLYAIV